MKPNILFVDDETMLLNIYEDLYQSEQYNVVVYDNPLEAIEFAKNNKVLVAFLDFRMPEMNGVDLRQKMPKDTPCYLLTGELQVDDIEGFVDVLEKPVPDKLIDELINNYLNRP